MEDNRIHVRAIFSKKGRAKFISHLDLLRCIQRSMKRAKLPVWYTQGFNPRVYLMFPLALSLGLSSSYEIMDFSVTENISFEEIKERFNNALPEGLRIEKITAPIKKHTEIAYAEYILTFPVVTQNSEIKEKLNEFLSLPIINVEKFSKKKGNITTDIKNDIADYRIFESDGNLNLYIKLSAGTERNIGINTVTDAFKKSYDIEFFDLSIERTKILCENNEYFI